MKFDVKPPIVLTFISTLVCALLVVFYHLTYVDTTGVITPKLELGLTELFSKDASSFTMLVSDEGNVVTYEGVTSVIVGDAGEVALEVVADGYEKGGIHMLVAIENGEVRGVSIVGLTETPGVGTNVQSETFLAKFLGLKNGEVSSVDTITGATRSSKGVKNGVETALNAYISYKEDYPDGN